MQRPGVIGGALVALCLSAGFAPKTAFAQAGTVVVEQSRVYVFVGKKGAGHEHGVEGRLAGGEIHLDRAQQVGGLTFDLRSFAADTSNARKFFKLPGETDAQTQSEVNANMHGPSVLNVAQFPTAEFVITQARPLQAEAGQQGQPYQLDGELTLHGVKKSVQIVATAESVNGLTRLRGRVAFKQTDFGIKPFSKLLGAVGVADELHVYADLWLR
jgi:polyisoprenoid-binding protein YceI